MSGSQYKDRSLWGAERKCFDDPIHVGSDRATWTCLSLWGWYEENFSVGHARKKDTSIIVWRLLSVTGITYKK